MAGALINVERFYDGDGPPSIRRSSASVKSNSTELGVDAGTIKPDRENGLQLVGPDPMRTLTGAEPPRVSGFPMSSRPRCMPVAPALRSGLGCERAGQPAGTVFVYRSGSLEVCRF
jgi:hypothetical protein